MNVLTGFVDSLMTLGEKAGLWAVGTVSTVTAGAAADGNPLVEVSWQTATVRAAYLSSYTPVVGHVVFMARLGPRLVILGRLIGTPPTS